MRHFLIALTIVLAGCASYTAQLLDSEKQQAALEARRLDTPELRQFVEHSLAHEPSPWPPRSWDLTTLTLAAFFYHPDLDEAQTRRLGAEAAITTAGGWANPTAGVSFQRSESPTSGASPWTNGLSIDLPIGTAGKRNYRIEHARHLAESAKLREAETVWQVRSRVRAALLAAYPTEPLMQRQRDLQEEIVRILERRFAVGYVSQPDLTQAHLTLNRAALALRETQKQRAEGLARLAASVGIPAKALDGAELSFDAFERLPPAAVLPSAEMRRQALLSRPDVLAALADYEASQSALQLEIAKQYPDVSIGPGYLWDQGQVSWSLGLSLVLPLLNRNEGPIAEAKARREEVAAAFLAVQAQAIAEVDEALASYSHAVQLLDTAETLLRDQQRAERSSAAAFRVGETDRLAWLSAQDEALAAELARVNSLLEAQQALGRLENALRRPIGANALAITTEQMISSRPRRYGEQP